MRRGRCQLNGSTAPESPGARFPRTNPTGASHVQVPESLRQRRVEVVTKLKSLEAAVKPITEFLRCVALV